MSMKPDMSGLTYLIDKLVDAGASQEEIIYTVCEIKENLSIESDEQAKQLTIEYLLTR